MVPLKVAALIFYILSSFLTTSKSVDEFSYSGFRSANLSLDGMAKITPNGLLKLSNTTTREKGHAFYPDPIEFKNSSNAAASSFSSYSVFAMVSGYQELGGPGIIFVISPSKNFERANPALYLGLFNKTNDGNSSNHIFGVELDTFKNDEVEDIDDNHVGIDINGLKSVSSKTSGYWDNPDLFRNLTLNSGHPTQLWVEYDGIEKQISVTLAPLHNSKPNRTLLQISYDLSSVLKPTMFVGFSSATGPIQIATHYVLGWSFKINGMAQPLDLSRLPKLPRTGPKKISKVLTVYVPVIVVVSVTLAIWGVVCYVNRRRKFAEVLEEWERDYSPQRFKFKDLYKATKGFKDKEILGRGGFGKVYKGVMPRSKVEIAVKRVSHESRQGMREFVAEIASMGRLRHRNLVPLLGYCRRKSELLLVYEYMSNGSLDKFLDNQPKVTLNWDQRFRVIKGVASGLLYLHEEWEQVVIHRDIKASNVLLDGELNGRLGDFGLARLYDHGSDHQTTHVVGTLGYLAPEQNRTGKATTSTDVYAFGAFLLEVACGRRPIDPKAAPHDLILVDQVFSYWNLGDIFQAVDPNLGNNYVIEEMEVVLKLGLLCSHSDPKFRPSMRQVMLYLEGALAPPELPSSGLKFEQHDEGCDNIPLWSYPSSSTQTVFTQTSSVTNCLSGGR
ncbi:L-type lectin-domain containing receptor kinase -like [Olea europaea subsp. europaea]|uniref:non-specific serine/threonine protein kinase n=1 Tax=Olea europaea subsp. europaea TaxID=158383 RepID=A0A8S0QFT2_OLEEU|nr:L-type lectin-domain containing receptor kinase -like [Olea europaea subsp. europaea]